MNPVLEFKSVAIRYPGNAENTVSGVSFHVHPDERVALFGLNGSGKTTLLLAAAGLVPFSGTIWIDGISVEKKNMQRARDKIGFLFNVPEDQILFPHVLDDVAYGLVRRGVAEETAREKSLAALAALGVAGLADRSPFQLSHGQRQRVALAGALVTGPKVLLLDEPTSGLDPLGRLSLANVLRAVPSSILIATHDVDFASRTCSRFLVLCENEVREYHECKIAEAYLLGDPAAKAESEFPH